jgi:chromosome segregation ATPase
VGEGRLIKEGGGREKEGTEREIEDKERRIAEREGEIQSLKEQIRSRATRGEELKRILDDLQRENQRL